MRDRLLDIMMNTIVTPQKRQYCDADCAEAFADELVKHGIILPTFKIGDTVWVLDVLWGVIPCTVDRPYHCICGESGGCTYEMSFAENDIGDFIFSTREEAERAMRSKREESFKRFLELPEDKRFECLAGTKLNWLQRINIKLLNKWWTFVRKNNPDLRGIDLWESIYKSRF